VTVLALALPGCDDPDVLVDASRNDPSLGLTVFACPADAGNQECQRRYGSSNLMTPKTSSTHRTLGIYDQTGANPVQVQLGQTGGAAGDGGVIACVCRRFDVTVRPLGPSRVTIRATLPLVPGATACDPPGQCAPEVDCCMQ
jgi:hypothetical protein